MASGVVGSNKSTALSVSETLKLTDKAVLLFEPTTPEAIRTQTKLELAIMSIAPFRHLYQTFQGGSLPAPAVMIDALDMVEGQDRQRCVDIFIGNAKFIGLIIVR